MNIERTRRGQRTRRTVLAGGSPVIFATMHGVRCGIFTTDQVRGEAVRTELSVNLNWPEVVELFKHARKSAPRERLAELILAATGQQSIVGHE